MADVRSVFNKFGGNLGTMGSLAFLFDHKCMFTFKIKEGMDMEELILDLIDYDVEDEYEQDDEEGTITIYGDPKAMPLSRNIWKNADSKMSVETLLISRTT